MEILFQKHHVDVNVAKRPIHFNFLNEKIQDFLIEKELVQDFYASVTNDNSIHLYPKDGSRVLILNEI